MHKSQPQDFGRRMRHLRFKRRVSQLRLEAAAGLSPGMISRIETGKVNPSKETLYKVATCLELSTYECMFLYGLDLICQNRPSQLEMQFSA